ncbi:peptidyl-prolyl cis-trans isomerase [bacterium]|nr:peptidyl-prolyl cis-trans isomerase [bacterium]
MRCLRLPLLHFLLGGVLLFGIARAVRSDAGRDSLRSPVVITAAEIATMRDAYTRETGLQPTAADEAALVDRAVDEELLFRAALARGLDRDRSVRSWLIEQMRILTDDDVSDDDGLYARARALGLDRKDLVVRRIVVQKMRLLAARAGEDAVSEQTLRAFYDRHRDDYRAPDRVSVWHLYVAAARADDAAPLFARARAGALSPAAAVRHGDPFPQPPHLVDQSRQQLVKLFGAAVADAILAAPSGSWVGPLRSPLGVHLFWIEGLVAGAAPPFEAVRGRVLAAWRQEHRAERLTELLRALRDAQPLQVESTAWRERPRA